MNRGKKKSTENRKKEKKKDKLKKGKIIGFRTTFHFYFCFLN